MALNEPLPRYAGFCLALMEGTPFAPVATKFRQGWEENLFELDGLEDLRDEMKAVAGEVLADQKEEQVLVDAIVEDFVSYWKKKNPHDPEIEAAKEKKAKAERQVKAAEKIQKKK